ncbi:heavy-metal-associated domain-containing protein [Flavobacterium sp. GT3P67]|uniref:heavy-metal-associated domain-containing protein n=1 Tax=Flavobacterium sp. GT3P67 TaxID=2541722 RepID=UPI0010511989|nr:heavy metal transport/detoxification protein [Flavobacterium sp. GT3P67]TDE53278.1 heavy metal transport/detoxification protein [Flavobacterium sp. GT3P67]
MNTLQFKSNIKCAGCIAKATPVLNEKIGEGNWEVDIMTLKKTLTVSTNLNETEVISIVNEAGFSAEVLQ